MKKLLVLFLALVMLLGCLAACKGNSGNTVIEDDDEDEFAPLPEADYSKKTYTILYRAGERYEEEWLPGESNDGSNVISEAIATRNQKVKSRYGVELDLDTGRKSGSWSDFWGPIQTNTQDDIYQLVAGKTYEMAGSSTHGDCLNWLKQVPVVDLTAAWWDRSFTDASQYQGCTYIAMGPLSLTNMYTSACIYFNKTMLDEAFGSESQNPTEDLFQLVKDGKWTLDTLITYAKKCTVQSESSEGGAEIYGLCSNNTTTIDAYMYGWEIKMATEKLTANGKTIVLKTLSNGDKLITLSEKLKDFYNESGTVVNAAGSSNEFVGPFTQKQAVFSTGSLYEANAIQNLAPDLQYGIIPYPKETVTQEEYHTYKLDLRTGFCIPRTVAENNREFVGTITEALAYYSNKYVKPALYDKVLRYRNAQDRDSSELVEIIVNGGLEDFAYIYGYSWDNTAGPAHLLRHVVQSGTANYSTEYSSNKTRYDMKLKQLLNDFRVE